MKHNYKFEDFTKEELADYFIKLVQCLDYEPLSKDEMVLLFNRFLDLTNLDFPKAVNKLKIYTENQIDYIERLEEESNQFDYPIIQ